MLSARLRVMLVDDHAVVRTGYQRLLELAGDMVVVAEHADADAAYAALARSAPGEPGVDVVVLDLSMPGRSGLDLLRRAVQRWPQVRWLVFTMHDSPAMVGQALRAGADGFVTKGSEPDELVRCLRRVAAGERRVLSADVAGAIREPAAELPHLALSPREFDVLRLLVQGCALPEIATRLHLSPKTVSNLQTQIRARLGVTTAVELLRYAHQHRLIVP
ncbi:response regulator transcription factor [Ideonella sp. A 288]|uniref:response regulator n=1 Tax=Ideonella sp. A 288 TaxID=1962181 RepID=UPI000B4A7AD9|nr:response regulator transcription factor [Ideonella sp. A 288]